MRFLTSAERKKLIAELDERFGITNVPESIVESGKGKLRGFTGNIDRAELAEMINLVRVEFIGAYLFRHDLGLRLSIDATHLFKNQVSKNIVEIDAQQFDSWIRGANLSIEKPVGVYLIKFGDDFVGSAYSNGKVLYNYIPKERQLKNKIVKSN